MELAAFTPVFRTHEGNLPQAGAQAYSNARTLAHFGRMARVYAAWDFYRQDLMQVRRRFNRQDRNYHLQASGQLPYALYLFVLMTVALYPGGFLATLFKSKPRFRKQLR